MGSALSSGVWKALRQKSVGFVLTSLGLGLLTGSAVWANSDVEKNIANEKNWAMQAGDMSNQRYSRLKQINKGNVDKLRVAWTFSTGVLRGQHLEQGTSLIDMDKACGQPAFAHWAQYDSQHSRNVVQLYLQTEREFLMAPEALKQ